jgi:hypothetical protein
MPENPETSFLSKEIGEPARPGGDQDQEWVDDSPALVLANRSGLAHLWRDLLGGGS